MTRPYRIKRARRSDMGPRSVTVDPTRIGAAEAELVLGLSEEPEPDAGELAVARAERPRTRAQCAGGFRPCPWLSCRHHLAIDITEAGSIKLNRQLELEQLTETCALDVADRGGMTLDLIGMTLNVTRERVRQIERNALAAMEALGKWFGVRADVAGELGHGERWVLP